jgi:hypothetical protein
MKVLEAILVGSLAVVALGGAATAQVDVLLTPGTQAGAEGRETLFEFGFTGDGSVVSGGGFDIDYDPATAPYTPVADENGVVDCTVAEGANSDPGLVLFDPDRRLFAVSFGDFTPPLILPIGLSGVILRCKVQIHNDADGLYVLPCKNQGFANDALGTELTTSCTNGTLSVGTSLDCTCVGDRNFNTTVDSSEAALSLLAFIRRNASINPAADCDMSGIVTSAEAARATLNFIRRECLRE